MTDKNKQLMLARGSKTGSYDADSPDQSWRFDLRHGVGEVKALAWIQSKTIAFGHQSPYCVDEHGKPVYIDAMAFECGWEEQTARNYCAKFERQGRIRLDAKRKRIWYAADVPLASADLPDEEDDEDEAGEEPEDGQPERRSKSEKVNSVQSYVSIFINKLPSNKRVEALNKIEALTKWKEELFSDGMAALRRIADRVEDNTLREIGVPKKRLPKRREESCKWVQLELLVEPNFVHSYGPEASAESVQNPKSSSYEPKINGVRTQNGRLSLLCSTPTPTIEATAPKSIQENQPVSQSVSPLETDRPTDSPLAASLEHSPEAMAALLLDELGPQFPGQMPGKALCEQTVEALADTPWGEFSAKLRNRKWKASDGMGIVLPLAREVQARWKADAGKRQERKPAIAARSLCPKCSGAGLLNGKKWESLQDLAGVLPAECCDCEDGITTLGLLDSSAKAAGGSES